ncbi:MAG: permease-like cell division protein FtsX [Clostridia bacterium]|nr:permease-like cell division protein FtsX [Clostridia bacterium]
MAKEKRGGGSLGYLTKEGFRNIWLNRLMSVASISVLLACLVMMGIAYMLIVNMQQIITNIEDANVIVTFLDDDADKAKVQQVKTDLMKIENVKDCEFVDGAKAFEEQKKNLGADKAIFEGIENPLPHSYRVVLEDLNQFDSTLKQIKKVEGIQSVREDRELSQQVAKIRETVTIISLGVIVILLIVSLFIISNTIKITMFSRRLEIKIMKSVGATSWFIRWPFMVEGMLLGIIAGGLALGLIWGVYELVGNSFGGSIGFLMNGGLVPFMDHILTLLIAFLAVGIITGAFGSAVSISKYLKEQEYDPDEE